jgi:hypothetical protein
MGRFGGHQWGDPVAAYGEIPVAAVRPDPDLGVAAVIERGEVVSQ